MPVVDIGRDDARASSIRGDDTGRGGKEKGNERDGMAFGDDDGLGCRLSSPNGFDQCRRLMTSASCVVYFYIYDDVIGQLHYYSLLRFKLHDIDKSKQPTIWNGKNMYRRSW